MYTSIVSCNVKKNKFCSSTWATNENSCIQQQPLSSNSRLSLGSSVLDDHGRSLSTGSYHQTYSSIHDIIEQEGGICGGELEEEGGGIGRGKMRRPLLPLPSMDGVPEGLEFLIDLNQIIVREMAELFDVMKEYETGHYKLYSILNGSNERIYFAAVNSTPRENCCDVQRKFKIQIVDYHGRVVLILERPYSCSLDVTNNCWMCCCCWCGSIGGKLIVKQPNGNLIGYIEHIFNHYRPKYNITDPDGNTIMKIRSTSSCSDCCNVLSTYMNCNRTNQLHITNDDKSQLIGTIKKVKKCDEEGQECEAGFSADFPRNLGLKWKALILGGLFLMDFMYFENGPVSARH